MPDISEERFERSLGMPHISKIRFERNFSMPHISEERFECSFLIPDISEVRFRSPFSMPDISGMLVSSVFRCRNTSKMLVSSVFRCRNTSEMLVSSVVRCCNTSEVLGPSTISMPDISEVLSGSPFSTPDISEVLFERCRSTPRPVIGSTRSIGSVEMRYLAAAWMTLALIGMACGSTQPDKPTKPLPPIPAEGKLVVYGLDNEEIPLVFKNGGVEYDEMAFQRVGNGSFRHDEEVNEECETGPAKPYVILAILPREVHVTWHPDCGHVTSRSSTLYLRRVPLPPDKVCKRAKYNFRKADGSFELEVEDLCSGTIEANLDGEGYSVELSPEPGDRWAGEATFMSHPIHDRTFDIHWPRGAKELEVLAYEERWEAGPPDDLYEGPLNREEDDSDIPPPEHPDSELVTVTGKYLLVESDR